MNSKKRSGRPGRSQRGAQTPVVERASQPHRRRWFEWSVLSALVIVAAGYYGWKQMQPETNPAPAPAIVAPSAPPPAAAHFVGAGACAECHATQTAAWQDSQHAKAMQHASDATVLGDFDNASFTYNGIVSKFFRRDGKFFVNTDGADGKLADFEILYTFGLYPLQQYLVAFPDGRMQALSIAWDARPKAQGGARWYHLYPNDHITYTDPLHWTRLNQNWNWMCADCHTTKLARNYDADKNTYATTWSEMNVACEACHGPASNHVAWAKHDAGSERFATDLGLVVALDERKNVSWTPVAATGNAVRSAPLTSQRELTACAQCHSRRAPFAAGMDHDGRFFETHELALLTGNAYFADGQQREEVYDIGSFLQSRMHAHGVTCSDCHDPHSAKLRAPDNAVCAQCHAAPKYDVRAHTLHAAGTSGAQCAACHMPTRNYMVIDARHDHSIRIPRPDLSAQLDTPNACNGCHADKKPAWAAAVIEHAFGPVRKGFQTFGAALHDARVGAPGATAELVSLAQDAQVPAIARATALAQLRPTLNAGVLPAIERGLADADPLVRGAALDTLLAAPPGERVRLAAGLVDDPARIVRLKAARALAVAPDDGMGADLRARMHKAFAEYIDSQRANADRPEAHMNLGLFYTERNDPRQAEAEYRAALALQPDFVPGYANLADLYRTYQRDADAEAVLQTGLQKVPGNADLSHALGLVRVRAGRVADALPLLAHAAQADPANARYAYVYGVALHDSGQAKSGATVLEQALKRFPADREILYALAGYARDAGDTAHADAYAKRLAALETAAAGNSSQAPDASKVQ